MDRTLLATVEHLRGFAHQWAICGGWAIDLYLNQITRPHKDVDVAIWRRDQLAMQAHLDQIGWVYRIAHRGELMTWEQGRYLEQPYHTLWCASDEAISAARQLHPDRLDHSKDSFFEVLLNETDGANFLYRRETSIILPLGQAVLVSVSGLPILAPEIVLLYKSNNLQAAGNRHDFKNAYPVLSDSQKSWLLAALMKIDPSHEWLSYAG